MKKILFISPNFFNYPFMIREKLQKRGFFVYWVNDRPSNSILTKGLLRLCPKLLNKKIDKYSKFIKKLIRENNYDIVFVILGQSFNSKHILSFKDCSPNTKFILYMWDSFENFPQCLESAKAYDIVYTFQKSDAIKYNFKFLPLFFFYRREGCCKKEYFASFVGTIKKGKFEYLYKIKKQFEENENKEGKRCYFYFYLQSKLVFYFYKIFYREFKNAKLADFNFKKLKYGDILKLMSNSEIVVDAVMSKQEGLTMRTFEALAQGSKLFTNNINISNYDFYNSNNIYIYNGRCDFNNIFFKTNFIEDKKFLIKYNIDSWLDQILENI